MLGSGRPVLVVPYIGGSSNPGRRIVIAWDESREAARAVADALPLLMQATEVRIASIGAEASSATDGPSAGEALRHFLSDHDIVAKAETLYLDECSEADVLLSRIADLGADLLVMGCYGHTRLRELVLGGMNSGNPAAHDGAGSHVALKRCSQGRRGSRRQDHSASDLSRA